MLQFKHFPTATELEEAGLEPVNYVSGNTLVAKVDKPETLNTLDNLRWAGALEPEDKLSGIHAVLSDAAKAQNNTFIVEAFSSVSGALLEEIIKEAGGEVSSHPDFPAYIRLVSGNRNVFDALAENNEIAWFSEASPRVLAGEPVYYCPGPVTEVGPVGNFVAAHVGWDGSGTDSATLTYRFANGTGDISGTGEQGAVEDALDEWATYVAINFTETATAGRDASIDIQWTSGDHGDGYPFDGVSGVLAHAFYPANPNPESIAGDMHFDEAETWSLTGNIHMFTVALHELGHSLGLNHSNTSGAVMQTFYGGPVSGLHSDDIAGIRSLYATASTDDIVWQHDNGQVHYWPIQNGNRLGGQNIYTPVGSDWTLRGVGDVSGDGADDIVWQHDNGQVHYWPMQNGVRFGGYNIYTPVSSDWTLRGVGDVDGNGADDIIWQHANGQVHYWSMQNGNRLGGYNIYTPVSSEWTLRGVGDVNGDGTDDIIWQHANGQVHYWPMLNGVRQGGYNIYSPVGSDWTLRGVGDVNTDGTDDIIWQHANGQVHYWPILNGVRQGGYNIYSPVGSDWTLRGVGNLD